MSLLALPYPWVDAFVLGALCILGVLAGFRRSYWCLPLLIAGVVFSTFFVTAGTKLSGRELLPLAILLGFLVRESVVNPQDRAVSFPRAVVVVAVGLGVFACLSSWLAPESPPGGPGGLQSPSVRPFVQAASYGLALLYFLIPLWIGIGRQGLGVAARSLQIAATITAGYGLYQVMAYRFGLPFRGVQYWAEQEGVGLMSVAGTRLLRMSGLSNEPKQLAVICLVAFVVATITRGSFNRPVVRVVVMTLCGIGFLGAWSTGGFLAALAVAGFAGVWLMRSAGGLLRRALQVGTACAVLMAGYIALSGQVAPSLEIVRSITFERVRIPGIAGAAEAPPRIENAVIKRFMEHPGEALTGLGLGNYPYVVGEDGEWVWSRGIQPMHPMYLTFLADFGLLGLLALGIGITTVVRGGKRIRIPGRCSRALHVGQRSIAYGAVLAGLVAALLVSLFVSLLPLVLLFMGLLHSHHRQLGSEPFVGTTGLTPVSSRVSCVLEVPR